MFNGWNNRVCPFANKNRWLWIISCFYQSRPTETLTEIHFWWKMRVHRRVEYGSHSSKSAQVTKKWDILGTRRHLPFANFVLQRDSIKHYKKCFRPTCVSSFPMAEFFNYTQTAVCISFLRLHHVGWVSLNWGTGAYIQGSFLSTCLFTLCCV